MEPSAPWVPLYPHLSTQPRALIRGDTRQTHRSPLGLFPHLEESWLTLEKRKSGRFQAHLARRLGVGPARLHVST